MHALRTALFALAATALGCSRAGGTPTESASPSEDAPTTASTEAPGPRSVVTPTAVTDLQSAFKDAIDRAGPAVVSVYSTKTISMRGQPGPWDFLFPQQPWQQDLRQQGLGSGFVVDPNGYILTNNHVVEGADEVKVELADDREFEAKVVGTDPPTDLALLKIEADELQALELGDSDALEVGDWVLAIGNPFGLPQTVSSGIVSAKGRANVGIVDYENFIQTDAAVNPGNSGGPLVDLEGRVVGINTAIASHTGGSNGIAFAIPINMAKSIVDQLRGNGKVVRGHLGVMISELSPELAQSFSYEGKDGILVQDVVSGSAADRGGLASGDIITGLDGTPVTSLTEFRAAIAKHQPGEDVSIEVWRNGKRETVEVELAEAPTTAVGDVMPGQPPKLGIALQDITPQLQSQLGLDRATGVVIAKVEPGSTAAREGIIPGEILEQIDGTEITRADQAIELLRDADLTKGVRLRINRGGQGRFVFIKVK